MQYRSLTVSVATACAAMNAIYACAAGDQVALLVTKPVEVVSSTPLPGVGVPVEQLPSQVQAVSGQDMANQRSLTIADYMSQNLVGVNVNETQNNPFQPDVNFHGFTASPLLGTPQGLSVYYDGVRINEPFGDVVSWDLIPLNAISSMALMPGSNPLFGLNTLGGAISLQTKSGRTFQGAAAEISAGSWNRKNAQAEIGGVAGNNVDYYLSGNIFDEDGWRDASPTLVKQVFGKVGWQNETTDISLSLTAADNNMIGNGLTQKHFLDNLGWDSIHTKPDQTRNKMVFANLNASHWLSEAVQLSGNLYYRHARTNTLNGDVNDDFDEANAGDPYDASACLDAVAFGDEEAAGAACSGAMNRSRMDRVGYGFTGQATFTQPLMGHSNQFIVGGGYDYSRSRFGQSSEFGLINNSRGVTSLGLESAEAAVKMRGISRTYSVFATDTFSLNNELSLILSGRYNHTKVENHDYLTPDSSDEESLSGNHSFSRLNPALGMTYNPNKQLSFYAGYNEGSRAPTPIELGCANPNVPCKLPNAMAGDPALDMVVARTYEGGVRGRLASGIGYTANLYRTTNTDDIQFVAANTSGAGYFDNVGKTRREGIDLGLNGEMGDFRWFAGYSYVRATYRSNFDLAAEEGVNDSAVDTGAVDAEGEAVTVIHVKKGDHIPGIPEHQFKFRGEWQAMPQWVIGTNVTAYTDQYARGNENNAHSGAGGKVPGYAVVNLDTRYDFAGGWQLFAKLINVFDREYYSGGMLGASMFNDAGNFTGNEEAQPFYSPGAPRAGWIGLRYEFGGAKGATRLD